ncbi:MAG: AbrB/MazE/SpoVT family DNA-binding domain-containing protein [Dehalococcoidia bacterium]|nr:AbrB/MazE/SpoVT family DNA-binding domain-containing protein [Dehalococcoidia bacterium]MSQ15996.1 AbrB/MazE/SpoVT family DNA-binding domain-containing protein [Dehalococcoidia bacterium]
MQSKVSVRGQTVIPREIRKLLGITPESVLCWQVEDGVIKVYPVPADPVRASLGLLKGRDSLDEFLDERAKERARERREDG